MKSSIIISVLIALVVGGWILSGQLGDNAWSNDGETTITHLAKPNSATRAKAFTQVRVRQSVSRPMVNEIVLLGRTKASRQATLSGETPGRIIGVEAREGSALKHGQSIARLAIDDRAAILSEAKAQLAQRELEFEAASKLQLKGFQSRARLAEAAARQDAARAKLARIEVDIRRTVIRAPFDGVLQYRAVELGDYVAKGDPVAIIMDLDPILVVGHLSEREVKKIRVGSAGYARLVTGEEVAGTVRYISSAADGDTRTFVIELEVENPNNQILQGLTSELRLPLAKIKAHLMSPAVLTLADDGTVGVKIVAADDRVEFVPVKILGDTPRGIWVSGLPPTVTLITVGHEFVQVGVRVKPVLESATEG